MKSKSKSQMIGLIFIIIIIGMVGILMGTKHSVLFVSINTIAVGLFYWVYWLVIKKKWVNWNSIYDPKFNKTSYNFLAIICICLGILFGLISYFSASESEKLIGLSIFIGLGVFASLAVWIIGKIVINKLKKYSKDLRFENPKRVNMFKKLGKKLFIISLIPIIAGILSLLFLEDSELKTISIIFLLGLGFFLIFIGIIYQFARTGDPNARWPGNPKKKAKGGKR